MGIEIIKKGDRASGKKKVSVGVQIDGDCYAFLKANHVNIPEMVRVYLWQVHDQLKNQKGKK